MIPPFSTPDLRRAWAFAAMMGASFVFTAFAAVAVWLLSGNAAYTFWLGLAAHAQLLVCLTCIGGLLLRRTIKAGRDGIEISDAGGEP